MKAIITKIISPWLKVFAIGLVACSLQLIPSVYAIAAEGPPCSIFIHGATSPSQSDKYPKANPVLESDSSVASLINDNGQVYGRYVFDKSSFHFLWDQVNGLSLIDLPKDTKPIKLNNCGQLIGMFPRGEFILVENFD